MYHTSPCTLASWILISAWSKDGAWTSTVCLSHDLHNYLLSLTSQNLTLPSSCLIESQDKDSVRTDTTKCTYPANLPSDEQVPVVSLMFLHHSSIDWPHLTQISCYVNSYTHFSFSLSPSLTASLFLSLSVSHCLLSPCREL